MARNGFTLIEVLVSLFILALIAGIIFVLLQPLILAPAATSRLEALYLAQEGVEITRNIRDTNFAKIADSQGVNWLNGLLGCEAGCEADYTSDALVASQDRKLFLNSDGFYDYDTGGEATTLQRTIFVEPDPVVDTKANVSVQVSWERKGQTHEVEVSTEIHNWLEFE